MTVAVCVDPMHVGKIWPRVDEYIRASYSRMEADDEFDNVVDDILSGASLLWIASEDNHITSAWVTELRGEICVIVAFGGRLEDIHLIDSVEDYARAEGCKRVRLRGRPGWSGVLKNYQAREVTLERKL